MYGLHVIERLKASLLSYKSLLNLHTIQTYNGKYIGAEVCLKTRVAECKQVINIFVGIAATENPHFINPPKMIDL